MDRRFEQVDQRFDQVEQRFEEVDRRFEQVDRRFEQESTAVATQFAEQRAYTEFAFKRLHQEMTVRFDSLESKVDRLESRFDRLESKVDQLVAVLPVSRRRRRA